MGTAQAYGSEVRRERLEDHRARFQPFPGFMQLVSIFVGVDAGPAALPASIGHVLILSYAVQGDLLCGGIARDAMQRPA